MTKHHVGRAAPALVSGGEGAGVRGTFEAVARRGVRRDGIASRFSRFEKRVVFGLAAIAQSASCSMLVMLPLSCCMIFIVRSRKGKGSDGRLSAGYCVVRPIHQLLEKLSMQPRLKQ